MGKVRSQFCKKSAIREQNGACGNLQSLFGKLQSRSRFFFLQLWPPGRKAMACRFKNLVAVAFLSPPRLPRYRRPGRPPLSPHAAVLRVRWPIRHRGAAYDWLLLFGPGGGAGRSEKLVCWQRRCGSARGNAAGIGEPAGDGGDGGGDCGSVEPVGP